MNKLVIVINGNGGVGKDTLCESVSLRFTVESVSAITPIKEAAYKCGWKGEKTPESRKFLADIKQACIEYNDYPFVYLKKCYNVFLSDNNQILFVHIREPEEIIKFRAITTIPCKTLLIRRVGMNQTWGNKSDDNVENYSYDYIYNNDLDLNHARTDFIQFISEIWKDAFDINQPKITAKVELHF